MMEKKENGESAVGCFLAAWNLLLTGPMWLILLFTILDALGDSVPTYSWVLYWVYAPTMMLGILISGVAKVLLSD